MTMLRVLALRVRGLFTRPALDEEISTHISLLAADYERRGMAPGEAYLAARRQIGGVTQVVEAYRDQHRLPWFDTLVHDLTYAFRQLRKSPMFTAAAVLTLGLGIGANTAVFRGLDALLLRSLPVRNASKLVQLQALEFGAPVNITYPVYREMTAHQDVIAEAFAAGDVWSPEASLQGRGKIKLNAGRLVTGGYFRTLGVDAALGRIFSEADDRPDAPGVAVIGFKLWVKEFGGASDAIGKVLIINSVPVTVIGVAPRRFQGERVLYTPDLWLPMSLQPQLTGSDWLKAGTGNFSFLDVMAQLRPGVSMKQAQTVLDPIYQRLQARESGRDRLLVVAGRHGITLPQVADALAEPLRVLMWMVAAVLAIACCNLANVLLARGAARTHEIGVRLALGASRARLIRQLLTESLVLAALGTILGLAVAQVGADWVGAWVSDDDLQFGSPLSWRVLAFVAAISAAATCLFGVTPALAGTRLDVRSALQSNWRTQSQGRPRQLLGKAFVVAQVSICLMLLTGATLLARSLWNLQRQDWGFRKEGLLIADLPLDMARDFGPDSPEKTKRIKRYAAIRQPLYEKVNAIPGVRSAALVSGGPLSNNSWSSELSIPGRPARSSDYARVIRVSPRYFETMGIQILAGRGILQPDHEKSPKVAVLSQTIARRIFDGADPIGRYISLDSTFQAAEAVQVVGVSHDLRIGSPREDPGVVVFVPLEQQIALFNSVVLRTDRNPALLAESVRTALGEVNRDLAVGSIQPAAELIDEQLAGEQILAALASGLGVLALVMASVGLYSVISYAVTRRTQEMGIRMALGAGEGQIKGLVMRGVGSLVVGGIVLGAGASLACAGVVRSQLFGITAWDMTWLVLAAMILALVGAAAGYLPARRAARLNPLEALRQE